MGINDDQLLKKLMEFDATYFMYMFYHNKQWDEGIKELEAEFSDDKTQ